MSYGPAPLPSLSSLFGTNLSVAADQGTYSVSGQDAGLLYAGGNVASTSQPASLPHLSLLESNPTASSGNAAPFPFLANLFNRILTADQGAYTVTGQATLENRLYADFGSYLVSGRSAGLAFSAEGGGDAAPLPSIGLLLRASTLARTLTCDTGIYSINLSEALADFEVTAAQGAYATTGQAAGALYSIVAEQGTYSVSGQDAGLVYFSTARVLTADQGTYAVTGYDANLAAGYVVTADQGFFSIQGQAASLERGYGFPCETGTYELTGYDADIVYTATYNLRADYGLYELTGFETNPEERPTNNNHPGALGWKVVYGSRQTPVKFGNETIVFQEPEPKKPKKKKPRPVTVVEPITPEEIDQQFTADTKRYQDLERELQQALLNSRMLANANAELKAQLDAANQRVIEYANKTMNYANTVLMYANNVVQKDEADIEELLKEF